MDHLIITINKLQDVFTTINVVNPIDLPQIIVIGSIARSQSSGKSSVLENVVGRDFLPRGSGIVTRRPLILQLIHRSSRRSEQEGGGPEEESTTPKKEPRGSKPDVGEVGSRLGSAKLDEGDEWGEFLHKPGQKFFDFAKIREEIVADTDRKVGNSKNVSAEPINLRIFSPHVLNLTMVDLPGLTKVPVAGQPQDIERQIREMILKYIVRPNAIVLAVTAANVDLANSDGLKLAREVDPEGLRTIGVLTKVDLMDEGTNIRDVLRNQVIPLKLGYVPVVNRSQRDIDTSQSIKVALDLEKEFFENHPAYSDKAAYCGTPYLAQKLSKLLMNHIRASLPDIKQKIGQLLHKYTAELAGMEDCAGDGSPSNVLLSIITEFTAEYRSILDGQNPDLCTTELNGGARISFIFHELFFNAINAMDPLDNIKEVDIRTLLYNTAGSAPSLFVGTSAFETLIRQQIKRLEDPSLKCVNMVYDELIRILSQLLQKPVFRRFPALRERVNTSVIGFFRKGLDPTSKLVSSLVAAEACYINTANPNFIGGHGAMQRAQEKLGLSTSQPSPSAAASKTPSLPDRPKPAAAHHAPQEEAQGIFGGFFSKKPTRRAGVLEPPPSVLKASGAISEREFLEMEVIKALLHSYYDLVKRTIVDMVPKSIMLNLVSYSREELQRSLLSELYKEDLLIELLKESEDVVHRRKECRKMLLALQKADEIVSAV